MSQRLLLALLIALTAAAPASAADAPPSCTGETWQRSWSASPSNAAGRGFSDQTVRLIVTPHRGGDSARIRLQNRFGAGTVTIATATIGRRATKADVVPDSLRPLRFAGRPGATIAPGQAITSDAAPLRFGAFEDLAVSLHVSGPTGPSSQHYDGEQTSFLAAPGTDHAADPAGGAFGETTLSWPLLEAVESPAPRGAASVVAFGDSITDGFQGLHFPVLQNSAGIDATARYPDFLQRRLIAAGSPLTVQNAGISGNRIRQDGQIPEFGPRGLARLDADALTLPGVTDAIVLQGINDIGQAPQATSDEVIAGLTEMTQRIKAAGLRVHLGTLTPAGGTVVQSYGSAEAHATRERVNDWIRTSGAADSVIDFDAALRDPADPSRLLPRYDSSDHLHPSTAGYEAMARAVDLTTLRGATCQARGTTAKKPRPRLKLTIRRKRGRLVASVTGRDRRQIRRVVFTHGTRRVADRRAPFRARLSRARGAKKVRAKVTLRDGRRFTIVHRIR